jgi:flagellar L-ring protein precursor FlgH
MQVGLKITFLMATTALMLTGCASTLDRLQQVGKTPSLTDITNPQTNPHYQPLSWPMPETPQPERSYANSLWQPGARAFFRDQRAARVGDLLKVKISINEKAELDNQTDSSRASNENLAAPAVFGLEHQIVDLANDPNPANLFNVTGSSTKNGTGSTKRGEKIETTVAAMVTQILPNGNLVIKGSQEIRVNFELRQVTVEGVIRPEDISSDNMIDSTQIAEARIGYGGRGQITDIQQPRWGTQLIDVLSPF